MDLLRELKSFNMTLKLLQVASIGFHDIKMADVCRFILY